MMKRALAVLSLLLALAVADASTADAQGRGKGAEKAKQSAERGRSDERRPTLQRRDDRDDDRYEDRDERYDDRATTSGRRAGVPPGWCQGRGNPHNTVENCGYSASRASGARSTASGRYGSYEDEHAEFHRWLDQKYASLAADRPLDIRRQVELRARKSAEHERWHAQMGRSH